MRVRQAGVEQDAEVGGHLKVARRLPDADAKARLNDPVQHLAAVRIVDAPEIDGGAVPSACIQPVPQSVAVPLDYLGQRMAECLNCVVAGGKAVGTGPKTSGPGRWGEGKISMH